MEKHEQRVASDGLETQQAPAAPRKRRRGCLLRAFRFLIVLVVAGIVAYVVLDQVLWWRVAAQRKEFAARYGAVTYEDFIPPRPEPQDDAGRLYKQSLAIFAKAGSMYEGESPYVLLTDKGDDPGAREKARVMLTEAAPGLDLIMQARDMPRCRLLDSYDPQDLLPALSEVRELARWTVAQARLAAQDGDVDSAFQWVVAGLHLANGLAEEPTLIVQMVREACARVAIGTAEDILNEHDGPGQVPDGLGDELAKLRDKALVMRSIAGESAFGFDQLYGQTLRPLAAMNELKFRGMMTEMSDALNLEDPAARRQALRNLSERAEGLPFMPYFYTRMIFPIVVTRAETFQKLAAKCDMLEIALRLKAYKRDHGGYPDNLQEAFGAAEPPRDPFAGEPYHYTRDPEGFVLYCAGPDAADEEGIVWQCNR
jgi:hypothetical protein